MYMGLVDMTRSYKRHAIKQHRTLLEDGEFKSKAVETKKRKQLTRKLTKREIEEELNEGYEYTSPSEVDEA